MNKTIYFLSLLVLAPITMAELPKPTADNELPLAIVGKALPLSGKSVNYFAEDPNTQGYLAMPEGPGLKPAVILIHEWNGLADRVRETADALAAEGYVALAADLYGGKVGTTRDENIALMSVVNKDQSKMISNLNAAVQYLKSLPEVGGAGKVAVMGWCFGGGIALSFALGGDDHEGTAIFYGRLIEDPEKLNHLSHEVYGTFAKNDRGIPVASVNNFVSALRDAGISNDVHIYDHVDHGFWLHVDRDDKYKEPALDAWLRLKSYLTRVLH